MIELFCFALTVLASPFESKLRLEAENKFPLPCGHFSWLSSELAAIKILLREWPPSFSRGVSGVAAAIIRAWQAALGESLKISHYGAIAVVRLDRAIQNAVDSRSRTDTNAASTAFAGDDRLGRGGCVRQTTGSAARIECRRHSRAGSIRAESSAWIPSRHCARTSRRNCQHDG